MITIVYLALWESRLTRHLEQADAWAKKLEYGRFVGFGAYKAQPRDWRDRVNAASDTTPTSLLILPEEN